MAPRPIIIDLTQSDEEDADADKVQKATARKIGPAKGYFTNSGPLKHNRPSAQSHAALPSTSAPPKRNTPKTANINEVRLYDPSSQSWSRKRTAKDAFGRNGVSDLLNLAKANLGKISSASNPDGSPKTGTPGRASMNDLLARFATTNGDQGHAREHRKGARNASVPRPNNHDTSLQSLVAAAKQSHRNGKPPFYSSVHSPILKINSSVANHTGPGARRPGSKHPSPKSPVTPKISELPAAEGLGTSPRIVQVRDDTPAGQKGASPLAKKSHAIQIPTLGPHRKSLGSVKAAPAAVPVIHASIEAVPASTPPLRNFDRTSIASRLGTSWTDAEVIMAGYLYEVAGLPWGVVDKKMGRGYNTCATKYSRVPSGLKNIAIKAQMRWSERTRAIDALLATRDLDLEKTLAYLQRYIQTEWLPKEAADEFKRLTKLQSALAAPVPVLHENTTVIDSESASPTSGSDTSLPTIASTRPRRHVDGKAFISNRLRPNARLTDGQLDVRAMAKSRLTTPDSVIMSSSEPQEEPSKQQDKLRLFDLELEDELDEDLEGLYIARKKPYLNSNERHAAAQAVGNESAAAEQWQGTTIHQGFALSEIVAITEAIARICPDLYHSNECANLPELLRHANKAQLAAIAACAGQDRRLTSRTRRSIKSFLCDATTTGHAALRPERLRIGQRIPGTANRPSSTRHLLRRELGASNSRRKPTCQIRDDIYDTMTVVRSFTGASGDVGNLAWSPTGTKFAAGAVCLVDSSSMQYNRPNNLLFGNVEQNMLHEIPDHHRLRRKPTEGVNATHSMHVSQDPRLFETVSMVDFSHDGEFMFSVGYDNNLRAYRVNSDYSSCSLLGAFDHGAKIDLLSVHRQYHLLATGAADIESGVKVLSYDDSGLKKVHEYYSPRAKSLVERKIMPSALKWGVHASVSNYLMAGFSSHAGIEVNATTAFGELCLWDVERNLPIQVAPAAGNTFDCSWSSSSSFFATACAVYGVNSNRGTKSLVRVYNPVQEAGGPRWTTRGLQMECPALDINDVLFNPYNQLQVAAGATDGTIYVWDLRNPDNILHQLRHSDSIMELDPNYAREVVDTGVRFCAWADRTSRMYSGSSDGVLKVWDVNKSTEDALVKDVATFNSGIMSGAFTNDHSKLLVGEVNGSINLLEVGTETTSLAGIEKFTLQPFETPDSSQHIITEADSGILAGRGLLKSGKMTMRPLGGYPRAQAVQGAAYDGPYDSSADAQNFRQRSRAFQQRMSLSQHQCALALCRDSGKHFATEEIAISGRSSDRIPQAMRDALNTSLDRRAPCTMLKCTHCEAPARVREDDMAQAVFPLCERCSFGCLRCGASGKISALADEVTCRKCGLEWDIGVLGYSLKKSGTGKMKRSFVKKKGKDMMAGEGGLGDMGNLFHIVKGYHHSLWKDRPPVEY